VPTLAAVRQQQWPVPAGAPTHTTARRAGRPTVDYALVRRAALADLRAGRRDRDEVCDAHPELIRAGRHVGERLDADCPVCGHAGLRLVSYVYGDALRHANGRCIASDQELAKLDATHDEFSRYVVEVCLECHWNHLARHDLHGRRHTPRP
jgi:hypothetical protein